MILGTTPADARAKRARSKVTFFDGFRTDFIASERVQKPSPQAFLVEQDPSFELATHFHLVHQFQVVADGTGTLGRHELVPWTVHYASPESGYGPIIAGPNGLSYYTIRLNSDTGAWKLPEERVSMQPGLTKQQRTESPEAFSVSTDLSSITAVAITEIFPQDIDGLAAWSVRIPPGGSATLPDPSAGGGRFCIVRNGTITANANEYERMSVLFASNDERHFKPEAGDEGAELIIVQFPKSALNS